MASRSGPEGEPRRLLYIHGGWVLEVLRQVAIGPDLVRPTVERLRGAQAILGYLRQSPDLAELANGARQLLRGTNQEQVAYNASAGHWVQCSLPPPPDASESSGPRANVLGPELQLAILRSKLIGLAAIQEGLAARLERLEERLAAGGAAPRRAPRATSSESDVSEVPSEEVSSPSPSANGAGSARAAAPSLPAGLAASAVQAEGGAGDASVEGSVHGALGALGEPSLPLAPTRRQLKLPPVAELSSCISLLVSSGVTAHESSPLPIGAASQDYYAAGVLDDAGEEVGLVVLDLKATIYLGGTLMMLPRAELDEQMRARAPQEDGIAASAEVCNALTGPINAAHPEHHVRIGSFQRFALESASWAATPAARCDLEDSFGGRIAILARPVGAAL